MNVSGRELLWNFPDVHQLFANLDEDSRRHLESIAVTKTIPAGSEIASISEYVDGVFLVISGSLRVSTISEDGDEFQLGTHKAGEIYGLVPALDGKRSPHFVTVIEEATVVVVAAAAFRELVNTNRQICEKVIRLLCDRIRVLSLFNDRLALLKPIDRVVQCLCDMTKGNFSVGNIIDPILDLEINQYDLSSMLSLSRQSVNRALKTIEAKGLISIGYKRIHINNLVKLREFRNDPDRFG